MHATIEFRPFENRPAASAAAASLLANLLRDALDTGPTARASLVVSGGSTPGPCFDLLSGESLDWSRVTVLPSDERWVPADDPASNESLIRERLLRGRAATGHVLSFFRTSLDAAQAPRVIEQDLASLTQPFSVSSLDKGGDGQFASVHLERRAQPFSASLLGMGEDGHFASLFPDYDRLDEALDPLNPTSVMMVKTAGSPHLRISLTLSALLNSVHTILLIFGEAKRLVFETAMTGDSSYPIEALLSQTRQPLTVIWAP